MAYWMLIEGRTPDERQELDDLLAGTGPAARRETRSRARLVERLGGEVRGGRR